MVSWFSRAGSMLSNTLSGTTTTTGTGAVTKGDAEYIAAYTAAQNAAETSNTIGGRNTIFGGYGFQQDGNQYLGEAGSDILTLGQSGQSVANMWTMDYNRVNLSRSTIDAAFQSGELGGFISEYFGGSDEAFSDWWSSIEDRTQVSATEAQALSTLAGQYYTGSGSTLTDFVSDDLGVGDLADSAEELYDDTVGSALDGTVGVVEDIGDTVEAVVVDPLADLANNIQSMFDDFLGQFEMPDYGDIEMPGGEGGGARRAFDAGAITIPRVSRAQTGYLGARRADQSAAPAQVSRRTLLGGG